MSKAAYSCAAILPLDTNQVVTPMRIALYARYSSDAQREASIEDQLRICTVRAEREGWTIAEAFTDAAISGATTLRPGYQAMLARLRQGGIDIVLAESLDRFSRDQEHIAAFYKLVSFAGVRIVTLAEGEISELHIGLKGTMGALYLKDLAAKTRRGLEGRIRQGRGTGTVPYAGALCTVLARTT
jgi:site-specific DNA recombinase